MMDGAIDPEIGELGCFESNRQVADNIFFLFFFFSFFLRDEQFISDIAGDSLFKTQPPIDAFTWHEFHCL